MHPSTRLAANVVTACVCLFFALAVRAGELLPLSPRLQPGDSYALSLETNERMQARSSSGERRRAWEDVCLRYQAAVIVLEVDEIGRATRELHAQVRFTYERPDAAGSLFQEGARYEVRYGKGSRVQLTADAGRRLDRGIEERVGAVLASRFEHSALADLLDPGRPVEFGESWLLDGRSARRLLRDRGLRAIDLGPGPSATLAQGEGGERILRYRIPVEWVEATEMPANARTSQSEATLEGELRLSSASALRSHDESLVVRMNGLVVKSGVTQPFPWRLESSRTTAQRMHLLDRVVLSGL